MRNVVVLGPYCGPLVVDIVLEYMLGLLGPEKSSCNFASGPIFVLYP